MVEEKVEIHIDLEDAIFRALTKAAHEAAAEHGKKISHIDYEGQCAFFSDQSKCKLSVTIEESNGYGRTVIYDTKKSIEFKVIAESWSLEESTPLEKLVGRDEMRDM